MINLDKNKNYLLACSYGPDSMALFDMLLKSGINFSAALVNYHLRPESNYEMEGFIQYCQAHNISYHVKDLVHGIGDMNIESECRRIRYLFFAELAKKFHYDAVLVAHNQDDVIETYLMQKNRQNLVVFYGIKEKTVINNTLIVRPLLQYSKAYLKSYCEENHVSFSIDSSNSNTKFLRNKYRHNVVLKMTEEERQTTLKEIADKNNELNELFAKLKALDLSKVEVLNNLPLKEFAYALNMMVKELDESVSISLGQARELKKILTIHYGNVTVPIKLNLVFRKSYGEVYFTRLINYKYQYNIDKPTIFDCDQFYLDFTGDTSNRNVSLDDYPLTIRTYNPGDKYMIKNYWVSVRRLFIDWKMPLSKRETWPLIVNKDGKIIYIPRYRDDFKVTDDLNFYVK